MKRILIGKCQIDLLPIVKGLVSEASAVRESYGKHEAYAIALGIEEIEAIRRRNDLEEGDLSELDLVYAHKLSVFGQVEMPTPAYCELVDLCAKEGKGTIPLDMNDDDFTTMFLDCVKATEYVKEHRLAKKGMKHKFDMSSPEAFVLQWDKFVHSVKGYARISRSREKYIAGQLIDIARYRHSVLAVVELEREEGILRELKEAGYE